MSFRKNTVPDRGAAQFTKKEASSPFFTIWSATRSSPKDRFVLVVGKSSGNAVHRHAIKRVVREALRNLPPKGKNLKIIAGTALRGKNKKEIAAAIKHTLSRL